MRKPRVRQRGFEFPSWGGPRRGAGAKPRGDRAGVSHRRRKPPASRCPVHVTLRVTPGLPSLRCREAFRPICRAFSAGRERFGLRLVHFSVQSNHLHLLVEARDGRSLSHGIWGLSVRIAKGLNRHWKRRGRVFTDRFHARALTTPTEVRNALVYVLQNAHKHELRLDGPDPFSSGSCFGGWRELRARGVATAGSSLVVSARTWLLSEGWARGGLISLRERPAGP